jgi:hypothetical protein
MCHNIKTVLKKIRWESVDLIRLAHDREQWWAVVSDPSCSKWDREILDKFVQG